MNYLKIILFIFLIPYVQIFVFNRMIVAGINIAPSLFVAAMVLFAVRMSGFFSYVCAFILGIISSILYGLPSALNSISFLIIVYFVRKFSTNFDMKGFIGQFILGFSAALFHFIFIMIMSFFVNVSPPVFFRVFPAAFFTGILIIFLFHFFLKPSSRFRG